MVEQCLAGEDEKNYHCSYRHPDCGDWIPYGNLCLTFVFEAVARDRQVRVQSLLWPTRKANSWRPE